MSSTPGGPMVESRLAFGLTVFGALLTIVASGDPPLPLWQLVGLVAVVATYAWLGLLGEQLMHRRAPPPVILGYFALQSSLFVAAFALSTGRGLVALMLIPLVSHAVIWAPQRWVLSATAFWALLLLCSLAFYGPGSLVRSALAYAGAVLFGAFVSLVAARELRARAEVTRLAEELQRSNAQLNAYVSEVGQLATARERARIAHEVHDTIGHYLSALTVQLEVVVELFEADPATARSAAGQARSLVSEGLAEVRRAVAALRPSPLEDRPLPEALGQLAAAMGEAGLLATIEVEGAPRPLGPALETALYRAAQEALTNVRKHAHASAVALRLAYLPAAVRLRVADNGTMRGAPVEGVGLRGLRERAALLGGHATVAPLAGGGCLIEITLPDRAAAPGPAGPEETAR